MESGTVSPKSKKWKRDEIIALYRAGKTVQEVVALTGISPKAAAGYKGYVHSPFFSGEPVPPEVSPEREGAGQTGQTSEQAGGPSTSEHNGHGKMEGLAQELGPQLTAEVGPSEAQALASIVGKPYLINVKNVYVSPDALKCYQYLVAKGFKGSVGEFFELCVLKIFKERYGVVPGMIMPPAAPPQ